MWKMRKIQRKEGDGSRKEESGRYGVNIRKAADDIK